MKCEEFMLGLNLRPTARVVQFDVVDPVARHVEITGDFTGWVEHGLRLRQQGNGGWRAVLTLEPGEYQYRLRINGKWGDHPEATRRVANPFGSENCVLEVR
jgi:1,4-alpha-glucan branching enzyme